MNICAVGNLGSGKTLITTIINSIEKREVWSNYKINIPNYRKLEIIDLLDLKDNIVLIMDEGYSWIESRVSSSAINEYVSSIIFHSRKTFTDIYITTPMFSALDKRFRKQTNILIYCNPRKNLNKDDFRFTFYDLDNNTYSIKILSYIKAKKYFKLYNTYEKVESHRKKGLEFNIIKHYPHRLKIRINEIIESVQKYIINNNKNGKLTHDKLKSYLLDLEIDLNYEPYVFVKLKGK